MTVTIHIDVPRDVLPSAEELADAGRQGMEVLVKEHLLARNESRPKRGLMPKSNYYADAAKAVTSTVSGKRAEVVIDQTGISLHYYGGIVLPTKGRALAIPKHPAVHDQKPSEMDPARRLLQCVWPKGKNIGVLKNKATDEIYYLLIKKASIPADKTVIPTEEALHEAAKKAINSIIK